MVEGNGAEKRAGGHGAGEEGDADARRQKSGGDKVGKAEKAGQRQVGADAFQRDGESRGADS